MSIHMREALSSAFLNKFANRLEILFNITWASIAYTATETNRGD